MKKCETSMKKEISESEPSLSDSDSGKTHEKYQTHRLRNNQAVEKCRRKKAERAEQIRKEKENLELDNMRLKGLIEGQMNEKAGLEKRCAELFECFKSIDVITESISECMDMKDGAVSMAESRQIFYH